MSLNDVDRRESIGSNALDDKSRWKEEELETLWDDGFGTQTMKDYLDISEDIVKPDGGFCPVVTDGNGNPIPNSPVLLYLSVLVSEFIVPSSQYLTTYGYVLKSGLAERSSRFKALIDSKHDPLLKTLIDSKHYTYMLSLPIQSTVHCSIDLLSVVLNVIYVSTNGGDWFCPS
ncbi:hypothetical protein L6452_06514 [Arctium lappa]|uniref:Uncharacterized protein n=1 Tax=Arctium lappa TaxID=4217 RepID=A0ACB9EJR2_ARCLA|nr:hypothetical protein L6452_06514 [Arctium lappa]